MAAAGYRHPSIGLGLIARHLPRGAQPLLDAGAGTGLLGDWLGILGYPHVEALDISRGMLAVAQRKGAYKALHLLALERLPAALTQGLRDFFGAHTYGRIDADHDKKFHTLWSGDRSEVPA